MKITEQTIQQALRAYAVNHKYHLVNTFVFDWECDFFSVTRKTGNIYEYEVKCSKADFKKDFEKRKHFFLKNHKSGLFLEKDPKERTDATYLYGPGGFASNRVDRPYGRPDWNEPNYAYCKVEWHDSSKFRIPARFYYVCPEGLLTVYDIPAYAGLLVINKGGYATQIKQAPILHKRGIKEMELHQILLDKFWWLSQNMLYTLRRNGIQFKDNGQQPIEGILS